MDENTDVGMSMDDLLAGSIDDIIDLPGFEVPQPGQYVLDVVFAQKTVNDAKLIEASYTVVETLELADPTNTPPLVGTKFSQLFDPKNIYALDNFKKVSSPIYQMLGCGGWSDFFRAAVVPARIAATVKRRKDKRPDADPDKFFADVKNVMIV